MASRVPVMPRALIKCYDTLDIITCTALVSSLAFLFYFNYSSNVYVAVGQYVCHE